MESGGDSTRSLFVLTSANRMIIDRSQYKCRSIKPKPRRVGKTAHAKMNNGSTHISKGHKERLFNIVRL